MVTKIQSIPYKDTGYFTNLICDYLDRKSKLQPFYNNFPDVEGFGKQIALKKDSFNEASRKVLIQQLLSQYSGTDISEITAQNIKHLESEKTFTVTTGHQLNIFTGPLYFLYKIVTAINLAKTLQKHYPGYHFVPVYWMATEDHDFEEISFFNYKDTQITWKTDQQGPVGHFSTAGMEQVFADFNQILGKGKAANEFRKLFKEAYLDHDKLSGATRFLANRLFGDQGLVIVDGDDPVLKRQFIPYVEQELTGQVFSKAISKTIGQFPEAYKVQVTPRDINLFYMGDNFRKRIVKENGNYKILNTDRSFSNDEILNLLDEHPERFSPNALMRPLYEEVVLPNLCYIGGGAEVAYWMELKHAFEEVKVPFPILLLRNSSLIMTKKQYRKLEKLNVSVGDVFLKKDAFINKKVKEISDVSIDFSKQKEVIEKMFDELEAISHCTDKSFIGAVKAQRKKQLNGLEMLEKRLLKAQRRKLNEIVERIAVLHHELFPNEKLQERILNFSEFYEREGVGLINGLLKHLDPLQLGFDVLMID